MTDDKFEKKWACENCTYENFPATKKCALCRSPKYANFINEEANSERDIYKMASIASNMPQDTTCTTTAAPLICKSGSYSDLKADSNSQKPEKWTCNSCTFLNWPKAIKCTQCLTSRSKSKLSPSGTNSRTNYHLNSPRVLEDTNPLNINVNIAENRLSPKTSPNGSTANKSFNNDRNRAILHQQQQQTAGVKWSCKNCTFDNFPKSAKCSVCGNPRLQKEVDGASGGVDESRRRSQRRSPPIQNCNDQLGATAVTEENNRQNSPGAGPSERRRPARPRMREKDWLFLHACLGAVDGDSGAVDAYITGGGDPSRALTAEEVTLLARPSAFEVGYTLVHLAIRFQREAILGRLLTASDVTAKARKRVPQLLSPDLATELGREITASIRHRKADFPCYFLADLNTFALPGDIDDLPAPVQKQLFDEFLDRDVQRELEVVEPIINWSVELTERLGSRLYALWNRTAGDCLLDSVLQASYGTVFDRDNTLRKALGDTLNEAATSFYPRWKETETIDAISMHYSLEENQWYKNWAVLLSLANQPGAALEQIHVFALAHVLRRPIIVYGIKFVKSFRGENLGLARFQGVYLPLLWERSFCWRNPIALGYTRGHFSALVPMETDLDNDQGAGANLDNGEVLQHAYLPLMDTEGKLLPLHFLTGSERGKEEILLRQWLDVCVTDGGLLVALQRRGRRPPLAGAMLDEWLGRYRRLADVFRTRNSQNRRTSSRSVDVVSSDGETDDE